MDKILFGLEPNKSYKIRYRAVYKDGRESAPTIAYSITTPSAPTPPEVDQTTITVDSQSFKDGIIISWTAPAPDPSKPEVNDYFIQITDDLNDWDKYDITTTETKTIFTEQDQLVSFGTLVPVIYIRVITRSVNKLFTTPSSYKEYEFAAENNLRPPDVVTAIGLPYSWRVSWSYVPSRPDVVTGYKIYDDNTLIATLSDETQNTYTRSIDLNIGGMIKTIGVSALDINNNESAIRYASPIVISEIIIDTVAPGIVTNASASFTDTTYSLTFNKPADNDLRDFIISLVGTSSFGSVTRTAYLPVSNSSLQTFQMSLDENKSFFGSPKNIIVASIQARDIAGNVGASVSNINASMTITEPAPTNVALTAGIFSYTATWDAPTSSLYSYSKIYESSTQNGTYNHIISGTTPIVRSTNNSNTRWVRVSHVNILGIESSQSSPIQITPINPIVVDTDPPINATGLSLSTSFDGSDPTRTNSSITAIWNASTSTDLAGYYLRIRQGSGTWSVYIADKSSTSYIFNNLTPNVLYTVEIAAFDKVANISSYGLTQTITTARDTTGPTAPASLLLSALPKQIIATWTAPSDIDIDKYQIQIDTVNTFNSANLKTQETYSTTISFSSLSTGVTYFVRVRGIDKAGNNGVYSSIVSSVTPAFVSDGIAPPSSPTPTVSSGINAIAVRWTAVTNNDPVTYEVHVSTSSTFTPSTLTKVGDTQSTFMMVSTDGSGAKLLYATNYYFKIIAKDYDGSAAASTASSAVQVSTVGTDDIASNAITSAKIGTDAVGSTQIVANAITSLKIADNAITSAKVAVGAITSTQLGIDAVTSDKILANAITTAKIANSAITSTTIADGAITTSKITANAITAAKIATGTITANEIASGAITAIKIAADTITSNEIAAGAITSSEIAAGAVTAVKIAADTITSNEIAAGAITSSEIAAGAVIAGKIDANAVTTTTIAAGAITAAKIAADTITSNEIAANAITSSELSSDSVTANKILAGSITAVKFNATMGDFTSTMSVGGVANKKITIVGPSVTDPGKIFSANLNALGTFQDVNTGFYLDGDGKFSLKDKLSWNGSSLVIEGEIRATSGFFSGAISVNGSGSAMKIGPAAGGTGNNGLFIDSNNYWYNTGNFKVGSSTAFLSWNGTNLDITGRITATGGSFTGNVQVANGAAIFAGTSATSGARVVMTSSGITANNGTTDIFTLSSAGVNAIAGAIGGWTIGSSSLSSGEVSIDSSNKRITLGPSAYQFLIGFDAGGTDKHGIKLANSDYIYGDGTFRLGAGAVSWNGSILSVTGSGTFNGTINASGGTFTGNVGVTTGALYVGGIEPLTTGTALQRVQNNQIIIAPDGIAAKIPDPNNPGLSKTTFALLTNGTAAFSGTVSATSFVGQNIELKQGAADFTYLNNAGTSTTVAYTIKSFDGADFMLKAPNSGANPAKIRWIDSANYVRGTLGWELGADPAEGGSSYPETMVLRAASTLVAPGKLLLSAMNSGLGTAFGEITLKAQNLFATGVYNNMLSSEARIVAINSNGRIGYATGSNLSVQAGYINATDNQNQANRITYSTTSASTYYPAQGLTPREGDVHLRYV